MAYCIAKRVDLVYFKSYPHPVRIIVILSNDKHTIRI